MPVLEFPEIESSALVITTPYIGASAKTVQGFVTDPIERAVSTVPGVDYVDSSTTAGRSVVTAWLKLNESSTLAFALAFVFLVLASDHTHDEGTEGWWQAEQSH